MNQYLIIIIIITKEAKQALKKSEITEAVTKEAKLTQEIIKKNQSGTMIITHPLR